jgi:prepilin-type N-terminal cleavage/methylation domain-containing protein
MKRSSEQGFTIIELLISTAVLLIVLSAALSFFSRTQVVYTNERVTLDLVQDMRTVFDRFTNEIRMAGAGLPAPRGVIEGTDRKLIVRGDFSNIATIITSDSPITISGSTATFSVGTTNDFASGQTVSLLNNLTGMAALVKVTAVNVTNKTLSVNKDDLFPLLSGASITADSDNSFPAGTIINVIERRTYKVITEGDNIGAITRTVAYENTMTPGAVVQSEEVIARNVLDENGNPGLTFTYFTDTGALAVYEDGTINPSETVKVQIKLQARSANPDIQTGKYRTFSYTSLVQVRGQYVPSVGHGH